MKKSLGADAAKLTIAKLFIMIISMLVSMLLSRFRSLEEYGTYSQIGLIINLVTTIFMLGLPNSINYFLAKSENAEERREFVSIYFEFSTVLSMAIGIVLVFCMPAIVKYFNNPYIESFGYFLAIYPWTKVTLSAIDNILIVFQKANLLFWFRIVNSILLLLNVLVIQALNLGFREYMLILTGSEVLCTIGVYLISSRLVGGMRFSLDFSYIKKIFSFSLPIGLASIIGTLCTELDKLFIGKIYNTEQLAIYTNAARELPITIIATSISAVVMPEVVKLLNRNRDNTAIALWKSSIKLSYCFICLIVAGVFTYAEDVISILYSSKYIAGVGVFRIYTLILLLRCTYFGMLLNARGRTKFIFVTSVISLVLNVVLNIVGYGIFGFIGPAIASFLTILIVQVLQLIYTAKVFKVKFAYIFPWKDMGIITTINIMFMVSFHFLKKCAEIEKWIGSEGESVLLGAVWSVCYILIMHKYMGKQWRGLNSVVD